MSRAGRPQGRVNLDTILLPLHQIGDSKMQEMKTRREMDLQLGKVAIFRASNVKPCLRMSGNSRTTERSREQVEVRKYDQEQGISAL